MGIPCPTAWSQVEPLGPADPSGVDTFYLVLVTTIIGFITVFQLRANAGALSLRQWTAIVAAHCGSPSRLWCYSDSSVPATG